jgi:hypothetical protein
MFQQDDLLLMHPFHLKEPMNTYMDQFRQKQLLLRRPLKQ